MRYLAFRKKSTGEWTDRVDTIADGTFDEETIEARRKDVAAVLGVKQTDVEAVTKATDPRVKPYLALPVTVTPPTPQEEARERAMAAIEANKDTAPWGRILYDLAVADGRIEA